MNSMSKSDPCNHRDNDLKAVIKCGAPHSATIAAGAAGRTFNVGNITLNTAGLRDANIKFEFASNISIDAAFTGTLSYQIIKTCPNQINPMPVGPAWIFSNLAPGPVQTNTFSFFSCDCDSCFNDCCVYTVVVTTLTITTGNATISNGTLRAEAFSTENHCC